MKEIGGYIELEHYKGSMLHENGIKLNSGRNALDYLIQAKNIKKILFPLFMCDSCDAILNKKNVIVNYYHVGMDFKPIINERKDDEWLYIVNYYGQLNHDYLMTLGDRLIIDNAQAYYENPLRNVDTIYTCRKFFGVPDGAILYTDTKLKIEYQDMSYNRMSFLLGRYENEASKFYNEYIENNRRFKDLPLMKMSKLTENLLHAIDYIEVEKTRTKNFTFLNNEFININKLKLRIPNGPFMYPLYLDNADLVRNELQKKLIYIPTLWPAVFNKCNFSDLEYKMAKNILPLPVDQRYTVKDMEYMKNIIISYL